MSSSILPSVRKNPPIRRNQLIDEAIRLMGWYGYHGFTIHALARECELTNAGVLHHFGSKDRLLLAVLDEIERREEERIAPVVALTTTQNQEGRPSSLNVSQMLREMTSWVINAPDQARFLAILQAESIDPGHLAHRWFCEREAEAISLFTRLASMHGIGDPPAAARQMAALLQGLLMQWLRSNQAFDLVGEWERSALQVLNSPRTQEGIDLA